MNFDTLAARGGRDVPSASRPLTAPIYQTNVYVFEDMDTVESVWESKKPGFVYGRYGTGNHAMLEDLVAALEGAEAAVACASGMGATTALLLGLFSAGDHLVSARDLYGSTAAFLSDEGRRLGIETDFVDATDTAAILKALQEGTSVALVTDAGTPGISDPGFLLVREARAAGIVVVPVPGPSAVVTALSAAGIPADRFVFDGFLPAKPGKRVHRLEALRDLEMTIVCYESPHRVLASLEAIGQAFGEVEIVVARELTKQFEEIVRGTPSALRERFAAGTARGEFTLIIPHVKRSAPDESR